MLHKLLEASVDSKLRDKFVRDKRWPKTAHGLSGRLRRATPHLRRTGIDVKFSKPGGRERLITIVAAAKAAPAKERAKRGERA